MAGPTRVAVIGAGWAGLAAAVRLAEGGVSVTVFEAARQAGGRARTVELDGIELDNGQHILLGAYRETLALLARVNPAWQAQLLRLPLLLRVEPDFRLRAVRLPAPWHLAAALLGARGLGWGERVRALAFIAALRRQGFRLPADTTVGELLARHGQTGRLARVLWHPLCVAALNTPPGLASAQVFVNVLRDAFARERAASDLLLPRVSLSRLFAEPAAAFLTGHGARVRTATPVRAIEPTPGGWRLPGVAGAGTFSHVVCALPPRRAASLLAPLPRMGETAAALHALPHEPIVTVYLRYPPSIRLPAPMLGLAHGPGQWVFDRGRLSGPAGLLAVVISTCGEHARLDHVALAQAVARQLTDVLGLPERPRWSRVIAEKRATFSCQPGLARVPAPTPLSGLLLAGDHVAAADPLDDYPATLEAAVRSGVQCARLILES